jgi:hypothetical protein
MPSELHLLLTVRVWARAGSASASRRAAPGFYVADTNTKNVYFAPAAQLAAYVGDVLVGTELGARFFVITPHGAGYQTRELRTNLPNANYNLEGATYVSSSP